MSEQAGSDRGILEAEIWRLTGWSLDQNRVEELMAAVDSYAAKSADSDTPWLKPVVLRVTDLPAAELERLKAEREAACSEARIDGHRGGYQQGWNEGVAQGRSERPAQPRAVSFFDSLTLTPGRAVQAPDGMLWLFLGAPETVSLPDLRSVSPVSQSSTRTVTVSGTSQLQSDQRKCRTCREVKPLEKFYRDAKGSQGRKTQCGDCDAAAKRDRNARKAQKVPA
jgi:hypothetical protein